MVEEGEPWRMDVVMWGSWIEKILSYVWRVSRATFGADATKICFGVPRWSSINGPYCLRISYSLGALGDALSF